MQVVTTKGFEAYCARNACVDCSRLANWPMAVELQTRIERLDDGLQPGDRFYMVHDALWECWAADTTGGLLCIPCLEARMGRALEFEDLTPWPVNRPVVAERWPENAAMFEYGIRCARRALAQRDRDEQARQRRKHIVHF